MLKRILRNIPSLIVLIVAGLAIFEIVKLNVLPVKYLAILLGGEALLILLGFIFINVKKKFLIVLGVLLYIISIAGNIFGYYYLSKTNNYIDQNFSVETYTLSTKYIVVTSSWNEVNNKDGFNEDTQVDAFQHSRSLELAMKKFGNYKYSYIENGFETLVKVKQYGTYFLTPELDYHFIIESSNLLSEGDFKVIESFTVDEEVPVNTKTSDAYNVYINGLDYSGMHRDFNLIATINTKTHKVVLTSIPRDYYIYIPAFDHETSLADLGNVDSDITKEALEKLFDIKIDYTLNVNTESLVKIVDTLGGVDFCADYAFKTKHDTTLGSYKDYGEKVYVRQGCHTYNGLEILAIARERVNLRDGDRGRQNNCRQILVNIGKKMVSTNTLTNYAEILNSFDGLYTSNVNKKTITNLAKVAIDNPNFEIIEQSVDGNDGKGSGRYGSGVVYAVRPIQETVDAASNKMKEVLNEK